MSEVKCLACDDPARLHASAYGCNGRNESFGRCGCRVSAMALYDEKITALESENAALREELARAEGENDILTKRAATFEGRCAVLQEETEAAITLIEIHEAENAALEAKVAELEQALWDFGRHNEGCSGMYVGHPCKCLWDEAQIRLLQKPKRAEEDGDATER